MPYIEYIFIFIYLISVPTNAHISFAYYEHGKGKVYPCTGTKAL